MLYTKQRLVMLSVLLSTCIIYFMWFWGHLVSVSYVYAFTVFSVWYIAIPCMPPPVFIIIKKQS